KPLADEIEPTTGKSNGSVDLIFAENKRHFVAQGVAKRTSKRAGHYPEHGCNKPGVTEVQRQLGTKNGEDTQADGIRKHNAGFFQAVGAAPVTEHNRHGQNQDGLLLVFDPIQGVIVHDQIPQRAASQRSNKADGEHPDRVHIFGARNNHSGNGKSHNAYHFKGVDDVEHGGLGCWGCLGQKCTKFVREGKPKSALDSSVQTVDGAKLICIATGQRISGICYFIDPEYVVMSLIRLAYASEATFAAKALEKGVEPHVARILMASRRNNGKAGLVGGLYYGDNRFFQY